MSLYLEVIRFRLLRFFAYPYEIPAGILRKVLSIASLSILWWLASQQATGAKSFTEILSYFLIADGVEEITMAKWSPVGKLFVAAIRTGSLSNYLMKPLAIFPYFYSSAVGSNGLQTFLGIISMITGIILYHNYSPTSFMLFVLFLVPAILVSFSYNMLLGIMYFHITDASGIRYGISHIVRILSGSWIPLAFFPAPIKAVVALLPFQVMVYGPTNALQTAVINKEVLENLAIAIFWSIFLVLLLRFGWNKSIKKYEAIGI